jgi:hypothetical protein
VKTNDLFKRTIRVAFHTDPGWTCQIAIPTRNHGPERQRREEPRRITLGGAPPALAGSRLGRVLLHALCLFRRRPADLRWHWQGIMRELLSAGLAQG